ncbi:histidine kinase [Chelativorans intermedius]|uniref:Histidine kinase n=1 Tax=Chelativorans intermedius TaxID=515947 RepID=A0ABV6D316_9HYPH|nr:histidine kinase [Chelativorans intermedius]MCT8998488.1 histidine kinase [Chelativorans intermedius]
MHACKPHEDGRDMAGQPLIDRAHLARQAGGDAALEREVLELFVAQVAHAAQALAGADAGKRREIAHSLVGTGRAVGAFVLADCAARLEAAPQDEALAACLVLLIARTRAQVAGMIAR